MEQALVQAYLRMDELLVKVCKARGTGNESMVWRVPPVKTGAVKV